jgi:hypothetical protein
LIAQVEFVDLRLSQVDIGIYACEFHFKNGAFVNAKTQVKRCAAQRFEKYTRPIFTSSGKYELYKFARGQTITAFEK